MVLFISVCEYITPFFFFACPRGYVRYFGHVSFINAILFSFTSPQGLVTCLGYLSVCKCFLFLSCGLRIRLDILVIPEYGHSSPFLHGPKVMLDIPVIALYKHDFLFIHVG
jgi:hypothetical protein